MRCVSLDSSAIISSVVAFNRSGMYIIGSIASSCERAGAADVQVVAIGKSGDRQEQRRVVHRRIRHARRERMEACKACAPCGTRAPRHAEAGGAPTDTPRTTRAHGSMQGVRSLRHTRSASRALSGGCASLTLRKHV